ncbi:MULTISPECIES: DUF1330 domain-containing protein [Aureimonas]|jgi:uncharacterized protein (DUF1330 family)|uniref:Uncharacterized conserved protein, DUF1330 family n=1 Tax=Aureimonas jatrophae TaxID=1166073 RepID=A0A1H0IPL1_9HYPH|nr:MULTISPECIES: DUF1330 domain-containing protein [Aureimonas]MBB3952288.1 uncharacterized protein (DUF1330 family) [Aureimonas jatrophae]SDO33328.1 Uncharacterized conserved protein, DUF1330 family [Aureimonas jatrophae]
MPKAYWIAHVDVHDPERYKDYVTTAAPAMQRHGAKFLARGGPFRDLEGDARARNVVIEFASMEEALACYNSPEYQEAKRLRQEVSDAELLIVEGVAEG